MCEAGGRQILFCLLKNRLKLPLQVILYSANMLLIDGMQSNLAIRTEWQLLVTEVPVFLLAFLCFPFFRDLIIIFCWEATLCVAFSLNLTKIKLLKLITLPDFFISI